MSLIRFSPKKLGKSTIFMHLHGTVLKNSNVIFYMYMYGITNMQNICLRSSLDLQAEYVI